MENQRIFKEGECYYYLNVPKCKHISGIQIKPGCYSNQTKLDGYWCFTGKEKIYYDSVINDFIIYVKDQYNKLPGNKKNGKYCISMPGENRIVEIEVLEEKEDDCVEFNCFRTKEDAQEFLNKIKVFFAAKGIRL